MASAAAHNSAVAAASTFVLSAMCGVIDRALGCCTRVRVCVRVYVWACVRVYTFLLGILHFGCEWWSTMKYIIHAFR